MIRAGCSLNLIQDMKPATSGSVVNASHRYALRQAAHDILYTVANSCAINGSGAGVKYGYSLASWKIVLISVNCAVFVGLGVWGFFSIKKSLKKIKAGEETQN